MIYEHIFLAYNPTRINPVSYALAEFSVSLYIHHFFTFLVLPSHAHRLPPGGVPRFASSNKQILNLEIYRFFTAARQCAVVSPCHLYYSARTCIDYRARIVIYGLFIHLREDFENVGVHDARKERYDIHKIHKVRISRGA